MRRLRFECCLACCPSLPRLDGPALSAGSTTQDLFEMKVVVRAEDADFVGRTLLLVKVLAFAFGVPMLECEEVVAAVDG